MNEQEESSLTFCHVDGDSLAISTTLTTTRNARIFPLTFKIAYLNAGIYSIGEIYKS